MDGLIAVDGGGTKTEFILTDTKGNVLSRSVYAGTNLNSVSYEDALLTLTRGTKDAREDRRQSRRLWQVRSCVPVRYAPHRLSAQSGHSYSPDRGVL